MDCPKCGKNNKCSCSSCNPDNNTVGYVIILEDENSYQCCFCKHKFTEGESLDYEWDNMMIRFSQEVSPEMCLQWAGLDLYSRGKFEKSIKHTDFSIEQAFRIHFKMSSKNAVNNNLLDKLKLQLERDSKIDDILKNPLN